MIVCLTKHVSCTRGATDNNKMFIRDRNAMINNASRHIKSLMCGFVDLILYNMYFVQLYGVRIICILFQFYDGICVIVLGGSSFSQTPFAILLRLI